MGLSIQRVAAVALSAALSLAAWAAPALAETGERDGDLAPQALTTDAPAPADTLAPVLRAQATQNQGWPRLAGANRYGTMAYVVEASGIASDWAVIATGDNFPDALAASALAGARACPLLITSPDALSEQASAQVKRLGTKHAYIVGGPSAVGQEVTDALTSLGVEVARVAGSDRVATSVAVKDELAALEVVSDTVIVATGSTFPDALSIGAWAYHASAPILLTGSDGTLTEAGVQAITNDEHVRNVIIVGGESVVSEQVKSQLGDAYTYKRLGGANRYETSGLIAEWETEHGLTWGKAVVATGNNFPDALSGATLAGTNASPILLADNMYSDALMSLRAHRSEAGVGWLLGGNRIVPFENPLLELPDAVGTDEAIARLCSYMRTACEVWSLGYDQEQRWDIRDGGECDCSSLTYAALWDAGFLCPPSDDPETCGLYTGSIRQHLLASGWVALSPDDLSLARPGDILLREGSHVCVVVAGSGLDATIAEAWSDENGLSYGGESGDQTGDETYTRDIYPFYKGWEYLLRYVP